MNRVKRFLLWVCLVLCALTLAIFLTINSFWLYRIDSHQLGILRQVGLSSSEMMKNYHQMLGYLELPWVTTLKMTNFRTSYTGAVHFHDVKQLFLLNNGVLLLTCLPAGYFLYDLYRSKEQWRLIQPLKVIFVLPLVLAAMMLVSFNDFFIAFHEVLFRNTDWIFDPALDPIINALPDTFFLHCFILFFLLFEGMVTAGILWGKREFKGQKKADL
ncbi:TIGR01906 family membrane protein [Levilactobacillus bambusae]|uniref:TIGR01906 family membrane protein n=1 Tax=Levilactobacillus bambusae TaxID=2024736 RepID=A0A2V1MYQ8_9LACO|nr:TIGR01906 family membrane protein [Levilactobacillus bambusae]PWF99617.1 TIGR01906 family membrane protein [Levilactobacillus bambusae]